MSMVIKGEEIQLVKHTLKEFDAFGSPIYEDSIINVPNVVISPVSTDDVIETLNMTGKKAVYQLCIPKNDTNEWKDTEVIFWGERYRTIGIPKQYMFTPLEWNKQVQVERIE